MSQMCGIWNQEQVAYFLGGREWIQLLGLNWNKKLTTFILSKGVGCILRKHCVKIDKDNFKGKTHLKVWLLAVDLPCLPTLNIDHQTFPLPNEF
jgi:hypothetical protein